MTLKAYNHVKIESVFELQGRRALTSALARLFCQILISKECWRYLFSTGVWRCSRAAVRSRYLAFVIFISDKLILVCLAHRRQDFCHFVDQSSLS